MTFHLAQTDRRSECCGIDHFGSWLFRRALGRSAANCAATNTSATDIPAPNQSRPICHAHFQWSVGG